jgi:hypothetical protein
MAAAIGGDASASTTRWIASIDLVCLSREIARSDCPQLHTAKPTDRQIGQRDPKICWHTPSPQSDVPDATFTRQSHRIFG